MISRRALLRGAVGSSVLSLGLPLLEPMLNSHGTALAAGTGLPKRYGLFFWGHGLPLNYRHNAVGAQNGQSVHRCERPPGPTSGPPRKPEKTGTSPRYLQPLARAQAEHQRRHRNRDQNQDYDERATQSSQRTPSRLGGRAHVRIVLRSTNYDTGVGRALMNRPRSTSSSPASAVLHRRRA